MLPAELKETLSAVGERRWVCANGKRGQAREEIVYTRGAYHLAPLSDEQRVGHLEMPELRHKRFFSDKSLQLLECSARFALIGPLEYPGQRRRGVKHPGQ